MNKLIREICTRRIKVILPDRSWFFCRGFCRGGEQIGGGGLDSSRSRRIFVLATDRHLPLNTVLEFQNQRFEIAETRPLIDLDNQVIAVTCRTY